MEQDFLDSARKQFGYYKALGDKAMAQIPDTGLFWQPGSDSNSIAVIVQHLWGNMLSRWTGFLDSDGEKPWRDREAEFETNVKTREDIEEKWEAGWKCLFDAVNALGPADLQRIVYIRNMGQTVIEAINRQLCHYAYHVGQIVLLAKVVAGGDWMSLSIPKGGSRAFNEEKFAKPKRKAHFTDDNEK